MSNNYFFTKPFSSLISLFVTTILLVFPKASCTDSYFLACSNTPSCGIAPNISFPFYIQGLQNSFCGHPGFEISCKNDRPIIRISNNDYAIHQIFYEKHTLHVSNAAVVNNCDNIPPIQNLSLPIDRFDLSPESDLFILYKYNSTLVNRSDLLNYKVDCSINGTSETNYTTIAIHEDDPLLNSASESCENRVDVPIQQESNRRDEWGNRTLEQILQRGFALDWTAPNCDQCKKSGGKCGFNETLYSFRCFCRDRPHRVHCNFSDAEKSKRVIIAIAASFAGIVLVLVYFGRNRFLNMFCWSKTGKDTEMIEAALRNQHSLAPRRYRNSEVKRITKAFREKLGNGGFGSVFKGELPNGRLVAVKVLKDSKSNAEDFVNEVSSISRTSHVNIVTLLGFCFEGSVRALIYEFMPNGSLEKYIYNENTKKEDHLLRMETLYQIAVGIAQGLEYLHRGCNTRILHFDIKPHNILLDENFCPKISDFGLAKVCGRNDSIVSLMGARGTIGYIAPEVFCRNIGGVSHKSDVYSYGMMVLEMVGGRKNVCVEADCSSEIYFPHWIYNRIELGEELGLLGTNNDEEKQLARKMILVSLWCIQTNPSNRPPMCRVVEMLQGSLESLPIPPKPYLSSPSSSPPITFTDSSALIKYSG